jgi:hypothetical protein
MSAPAVLTVCFGAGSMSLKGQQRAYKHSRQMSAYVVEKLVWKKPVLGGFD